MAIASPSTPSFSTSFCSACGTESSARLTGFPSVSFTRSYRFSQLRSITRLKRLRISSRSDSSGPYDNGGVEQDLRHGQRSKGSPVYVKLPVDTVGPTAGQLRRRVALAQSFRALAAIGVDGVVVEVWWGLVEDEAPTFYNWQGYKELVALAQRCGLKVRVVMAFHQHGTGPGDPYWVPLPRWVLEEIERDPDLAYCDRFGRRNLEYISLGCDNLPVLQGRSPIQAYADFMRNFRDTFKPLLGVIITGIQVGMGPAGELRYPSCPSRKLAWPWRSHELGEFQCYDKYMLACLNACARDFGMPGWGSGGPTGAGNLMQNPELTNFFRSVDGSWNTSYGKFFLQWYSGMLLCHAERICAEAENIFRGIEVTASAKIAGIHWHYGIQSHPSELTAGYYNTSNRDGYLPIARLFARYGFTLCCTGFEMKDVEEKQMNPGSSPEGFLRQVMLAARVCGIPVEGENSSASLDDDSFQQMLETSKFYSDGLEKPTFSFNFERMGKHFFDYGNWARFSRFVRQMSGAKAFRAQSDHRGDMNQYPTPAKVGIVLAYCERKASTR